ncbi:hypothetical protein RRG08_006123 [Elysia crispata]|uniref:Secreted protein n=1 Tax=Elysia crispata TaxID=231223 RepID=A0AAE0YJW2_9GAST|nr:hypothetical protein RRG08_006123 [Elysia crispata]
MFDWRTVFYSALIYFACLDVFTAGADNLKVREACSHVTPNPVIDMFQVEANWPKNRPKQIQAQSLAYLPHPCLGHLVLGFGSHFTCPIRVLVISCWDLIPSYLPHQCLGHLVLWSDPILPCPIRVLVISCWGLIPFYLAPSVSWSSRVGV